MRWPQCGKKGMCEGGEERGQEENIVEGVGSIAQPHSG